MPLATSMAATRLLVFLGVRPDAEPILEIDPEVLTGSRVSFDDARIDWYAVRHRARGPMRAWASGACSQRPQRDRAELLRRVGREMRAAVDDVDRLTREESPVKRSATVRLVEHVENRGERLVRNRRVRHRREYSPAALLTVPAVRDLEPDAFTRTPLDRGDSAHQSGYPPRTTLMLRDRGPVALRAPSSCPAARWSCSSRRSVLLRCSS